MGSWYFLKVSDSTTYYLVVIVVPYELGLYELYDWRKAPGLYGALQCHNMELDVFQFNFNTIARIHTFFVLLSFTEIVIFFNKLTLLMMTAVI